METASPARAVRVGVTPSGALTYLVDLPPEALPPVTGRDLERAWYAAREAALADHWGTACGFRFRREDGSYTDIALADSDARCWAGAVNRTVGMANSYGLSLCLRLLALVDLLARASWAAPLFRLERDGAALDPSLLRAAAVVPLTAEARFDESRLRARLAPFALAAPSAEPRLPGATA